MEDAVYINPDQVALERFGDWNSVESVMNAARYCEQWREKCLRNNNSLIFETVLSSEGKLDFIRRAHEAGFFIRLFFVATVHPSINASRIAHRVMNGGHDVPITKIISATANPFSIANVVSNLWTAFTYTTILLMVLMQNFYSV